MKIKPETSWEIEDRMNLLVDRMIRLDATWDDVEKLEEFLRAKREEAETGD